MKIRITRANFISALKDAIEVAESRSTLPILQHVLLEANGSLRVSATDLELSLVKEVNAETERRGSICLPGRKLFLIVKELEEGEITLEKQNNDWVRLESGKSKYLLAGLSKEDFPLLEIAKKMEGNVSSDTLATALAHVAYSCANDNSRAYLNGVYVGHEELVATDGCRLARVTVPGLSLPEETILPRKGVQAVKNLFEEELSWAKQKNHITFSSLNTSLTIRLIDGKYPDYKTIIQDLSGTSLFLSLSTFRSQLDFCKALGAQDVKIRGKGNALEITAKSHGEDDEIAGVVDTIEGSWEGGDRLSAPLPS
ncbi:MAG TPA: DNA polymerase III subunit beta [Thermodesulfobacteriota bacterium]|nr:DNA polymerase III subunit beta [Thermodesulfobacteriota bacterium]